MILNAPEKAMTQVSKNFLKVIELYPWKIILSSRRNISKTKKPQYIVVFLYVKTQMEIYSRLAIASFSACADD